METKTASQTPEKYSKEQRNEGTIAEKGGAEEGREEMQLSKDSNLAETHQCVMVFKVKDPLGRNSDNRLHRRPSASHGPPDTFTQRDVVRPISSSACLPDAKPEWHWQKKKGNERKRQIGVLENTENYNSSRQALPPFNAGLKHYEKLGWCLLTSRHTFKRLGQCDGEKKEKKTLL